MDELTLARRQADEYAREADALRADIARLTAELTRAQALASYDPAARGGLLQENARLNARVLELEESLDESIGLDLFGELSDQLDGTDTELEQLRGAIQRIHVRAAWTRPDGREIASCYACHEKWPCPTVALLDNDESEDQWAPITSS